MDTAFVTWELQEAALHLQNLIAELNSGKMGSEDDPCLAVDLWHIIDHLCYAWNGKDLTLEQVGNLSQQDFERLSNTLPNFFGHRIMGESTIG